MHSGLNFNIKEFYENRMNWCYEQIGKEKKWTILSISLYIILCLTCMHCCWSVESIWGKICGFIAFIFLYGCLIWGRITTYRILKEEYSKDIENIKENLRRSQNESNN